MQIHRDVLKMTLRPVWMSLIALSILSAAGAALWVGLQQDAGETSTTYVFARRVGYLNRPLPVLDDHLNEIVNSVEFPEVFTRIEERLLLQADKDYDLAIGVVDDADSVVEIVVRTNGSGDADRISRIVAEEMVDFVLSTQEETIVAEINDLEREIIRLEDDQARLIALAGGVPPTTARTGLEQQLIGIRAATDDAPIGTLEGQIQERLASIEPLANDYRRNTASLGALKRRRAQSVVERSDISASQASVNQEWYRSITPVEPTSNVPVAIAMAFTAAIPAALASSGLVGINLNRRLTRRERFAGA
jgi:hypothetical protein